MNSLVLEYSKCCRICRKMPRAMVSIFDTRKKGILLAEMISHCTQLTIEPSDDRPANICKICTKNLYTAYDFCNLAKKSEQEFQHIVQLQPVDTDVRNGLQTLMVKSQKSFEMIGDHLDAKTHKQTSLKHETDSSSMEDTFADVDMLEHDSESNELPESQENSDAEQRQHRETTQTNKEKDKYETNKKVGVICADVDMLEQQPKTNTPTKLQIDGELGEQHQRIDVCGKRRKPRKQSNSNSSDTKLSATQLKTHLNKTNAVKSTETNPSELITEVGLTSQTEARKGDAHPCDTCNKTCRTKTLLKAYKSLYTILYLGFGNV